MLVLLLGPSGVGKSTIAQLLVDEYGWSPIISVLTRPERAQDDFKISISDKSYEMLIRCGKLFSNVVQSGHRYGLLADEIEIARSRDDKYYVLDYDLDARSKYFGSVPHIAIYIAAPNESILTDRIIASDRSERVATSLLMHARLELWHQTQGGREGVFRVVNAHGGQEESARAVHDICRAEIARRSIMSS